MSRELRRLLANTGYLFSSRGLVVTARAVYAVALARWLGPEFYGLYNYGLSWYLSFMPLAFWGISFLLSRELGRLASAADGTDPARIHPVLSGLFSARVITSLAAAVACLTLGLALEIETEARALLALFTAALLGRSLAIWCSEVFVARERADVTFRLQSGMRITEVALGCLLLSRGFGLFPIVVLHLVSWWVEAAVGILLLRRGPWRFPWFGSVRQAPGFIRQATPLTFMDLASTWMMTGPVVLFRHFSDDPAALGRLTFALQIFLMLTNLVAAFAIAVLPQMARTRAAGTQDNQRLVRAGYKAGFLFASLAVVVGTPLTQWIVDVLLTSEYQATAGLLVLALWLLVPVAVGASLQQQLIAEGRDRYVFFSNAAGALLMSVLLPLAVVRYGGEGALAAAGAGLFLNMLLQLAVFARREPSHWVGTTVLCAAVLAAGLLSGRWFAPAYPWLASGTGATVVLIGFFTVVFTASQRRALLQVIGSLTGAAFNLRR